jgi:glycosyltransferase involved in cell wall biosynthesis
LGSAADRVHILCVGETADYYDLPEQAGQLGVADRLHVSGYVRDDELPSYLAAADVCLCLRWPTARETSASWLRCVAAGKPTVVNDLVHTADVPTLDLRSMAVRAPAGADPIAIGIDMLDDLNMLRLALRHMADDAGLRQRIGQAARRYWEAEATVDAMTRDYEEALALVPELPDPVRRPARPAHLAVSGTEKAFRLVAEAGLADAAGARLAEIFDRGTPTPAGERR